MTGSIGTPGDAVGAAGHGDAGPGPATGHRDAGAVLDLLFICTANQCRSPLAEVLAQQQLRRRGINARVSSAGFLVGGVEAARGSQKVARRLGLDLSNHRSRRVTPEMIRSADAIITMEPDHVVRLAEEVPESRTRSVTLKELARRAMQSDELTEDHPTKDYPTEGHPRPQAAASKNDPRPLVDATTPADGPSGGPSTERDESIARLRAWVGSTAKRDLHSLLMEDNTIEDPMGRSNRAFRRTAQQIDDLLSTMFNRWFGPIDD